MKITRTVQTKQTCLLRIGLFFKTNTKNSLITPLIILVTRNRKNIKLHHEMILHSLVLPCLKATLILNLSYLFTQQNFNGSRELVSSKKWFLIAVVKTYCFYISRRKANLVWVNSKSHYFPIVINPKSHNAYYFPIVSNYSDF